MHAAAGPQASCSLNVAVWLHGLGGCGCWSWAGEAHPRPPLACICCTSAGSRPPLACIHSTTASTASTAPLQAPACCATWPSWRTGSSCRSTWKHPMSASAFLGGGGLAKPFLVRPACAGVASVHARLGSACCVASALSRLGAARAGSAACAACASMPLCAALRCRLRCCPCAHRLRPLHMCTPPPALCPQAARCTCSTVSPTSRRSRCAVPVCWTKKERQKMAPFGVV